MCIGRNAQPCQTACYILFDNVIPDQSSNIGLTDTALQARKEREANSQQNVETVLSKKYIDMKGVWTFLTQEHALYTAHKLVERGKAGGSTPDDQALKESYGLNKRTSDSF